MTIYIVEGRTGEYSDYSSWIAKAFLSEEKAQTYKNELNTECTRIFTKKDRFEPKRSSLLDKLDPKWNMDYTGTEYVMYQIEVEE